jgi:hypothetical protein
MHVAKGKCDGKSDFQIFKRCLNIITGINDNYCQWQCSGYFIDPIGV